MSGCNRRYSKIVLCLLKHLFMSFVSFDPLIYKAQVGSEVASLALKREIKEILGSYVGWYDPFCEMIQNSLDSVDQRTKLGEVGYSPRVKIIVNLKEQRITVSDNGMGLGKNEFNQFVVPFFSFKSGKTRGHKGVGATYLAYGFNYLQVVTKTPEFSVCGKMLNAKNWLNDENPSGNPEMQPDTDPPIDPEFDAVDRGASITVKIDSTTHPKDLNWIGTQEVNSWYQILLVKTGLGSIFNSDTVCLRLEVIDQAGESHILDKIGSEYLFIQNFPNVRKSEQIRVLKGKLDAHYSKKGYEALLPPSLKNFDCIYDSWNASELSSIVELDEFETDIIGKYNPFVYCGFAYSVKVFTDFNQSLGVRAKYAVITGGFQIAANNMPQGEIFQIPLQRYIGRQNQIHFVFHFENYNPDLGRKGYNKEITDFCKSISEKISTKYLNKFKPYLRPASGTVSNLVHAKQVDDWKDEMKAYEIDKPLTLTNNKFFIPTKKISITSQPTREQDVIALFNQLLAGGVIRGVRLMSTNERFTYDGLFRIIIEEPQVNHLFHSDDNPLGILPEMLANVPLPFSSAPEILEYKFSLDGLIEDIADETKNSNDIGLVVVWETGELYKGNYHVTSLIDEDNLSLRNYHGVTHIITNLTTEQKEMDMIVLSELVSYLNSREATMEQQKKKYDENY